MDKKLKVLLLIEILSFLSFGSPQFCKHHSSTSLDCSGLGLQKVPKNLPVNITHLDLSINNITTLYDNDFSELKNLHYLDLSLNLISLIQVDAFNGLQTLITLFLYGHRLNYTSESLPDDVFKPLKSLQILFLRSDMSRFHRHQPQLPHQAVSKLVQLEQLNIDTTPKTVFQKEFSNLKNLKILSLGKAGYKNFRYDCALSEITNDTFSVFNTVHILNLNLRSCHIQTFQSGCLKPLPYLKTFLFVGVYYYGGGLNDIIQALEVYKNKAMEVISIKMFYSKNIISGHGYILNMDILSQICVSKLEIVHANIMEVDFNVLLTPPFPIFTRCIKEFNLRENIITGKINIPAFFLWSSFSNLQKFDGSLQKIFPFNQLETLRTKQPLIKRFPVGLPFILPSNLTYIDIAGMPSMIGELPDVYFFHGENLYHLNLSYCGLYDFQHKIHGLSNLRVLDLSGNDLSILNVKFFDTFSNLTHLRLSNTLLDNYFLIQSGSRLLSPLDKLEILDFSNNDLVSLPNDFFSELKNLQMIVLSNNKLVSIPDVTSLKCLKYIHMDFNGLTTIDQTTRNMLDRTWNQNSNFHISLYGNVFYCGCSSLKFLFWLKDTRTWLDGRDYSCMDMKGQLTTTELVMDDLIYLQRQCVSPFWTNIAIGGLSSTFLFLGFGFVFLKNKLKFQLFFLRLIGQNVFPKERGDFINDVAVLPDLDSTYRFIHNELMKELNVNRGLKVDLGQVGRSEAINIVESIRDSWKIILIVTNEFLTSDFCLFTICNCLSAITLTTPNRIILLLDDEARIPSKLHVFFEAISQENVFHFDILQSSNDDFWQRVHDRLKFKEPT